jgi:hypothetical protein
MKVAAVTNGSKRWKRLGRCGKSPFDDYAVISALHHVGLVALTHTPNQMKF